MSKAKAIVQAALFAALDAAVTGGTVYQDAPMDAAGDLVILGNMKSFGLGGKSASDDRRVEVNIITLSAAEEMAPLLALQEQVEAALDGQTLEQDGWTLAITFTEDDAVLGEDGASYSGISAFTVLALA